MHARLSRYVAILCSGVFLHACGSTSQSSSPDHKRFSSDLRNSTQLLGAARGPAYEDLTIHFVDVGQGDCTLITCPDGSHILIDCGTSGGGDADEALTFLRGEIDDGTIEVLIVTHPDADHYNLLDDLLDTASHPMDVDQVYLAGQNHEYGVFTEWLDDHDSVVTRLNSNYFDRHDDPPLLEAGGVDFRVLASNVTSTDGASNLVSNTRSIVLLLTYGEVDVMITGDGTYETQEVILDRYPYWWLDVEVLRVGHHGSRATGFWEAEDPQLWPTAIRPEAAVFSASGTKYGHPSRDIVQALFPYTMSWDSHSIQWGYYQSGYKYDTFDSTEAVFMTSASGTLTMVSNGTTWDIN